MNPDDLARALAQPGRASFPYLDRYNPERPLALECFRPQGHSPDKPVVIVQHGASRNGAEYCEAWIATAERDGYLVPHTLTASFSRGDHQHRRSRVRILPPLLARSRRAAESSKIARGWRTWRRAVGRPRVVGRARSPLPDQPRAVRRCAAPERSRSAPGAPALPRRPIPMAPNGVHGR